MKKRIDGLGAVMPILGVILISWGALKSVYYFHHNWDVIARVSENILNGHAYWRAYQNRLLAPYLIKLISSLGMTYEKALLWFVAVTFLFHNYVFYSLLRKARVARTESLGLVLLFAFAFCYLQNYWLYPWDMIDLTIFTLMAYVIVFETDPKPLFLIFAVALLNRESALYVGVAVILASAVSTKGIRFFRVAVSPDWRSIFLGIAMILLGAAYTKVIRDALFISRPSGFLDTQHAVLGNHIYLLRNLGDLFLHDFGDSNIAFAIPVWCGIIYMLNLLRRSGDTGVVKGVLLWFAFFVGVMCFGLVNETRMLFPLIAPTIFIVLKARKEQW